MRQGNSNKRMRGRGGGGGNNTGRKGPSPLNRTYESTGPDVKIRGTALHIAEKYVSLARDAQSSGDPVLAESYLQHAEHYYRIIAAAQAAMPQPMPVIRSDIQSDEDEDDGEESFADTRFDSRGRADVRGEVNGNGEGSRPEGPREPREPRGEGRPPFRRTIDVDAADPYMAPDAPQPFVDDSALERVIADRGERGRGRGRFRDRGEFRGEPRADGGRPEGGRPEGARPPRERPARGEGRGEREAPAEAGLDALPAFLTAAPRVVAPAPAAAPIETPETEGDDAPRRRTRGGRGRGRRPEYAGSEGEAPAPTGAED